jgi:hypothetical protein
MTTLYKLTDQNGQTHNATQWGEGVTHHASGVGDLCSPGWLHAYTDPLLAVLLNPIHADITDPQMWICEGVVGKEDKGLKVGCAVLTTIRRTDVPSVNTEQKVRFGVLCALAVYSDPGFERWADNWLTGGDRTAATAWAAEAAATAWAAEAAAAEAAAAAAWAARAAAEARSFDLIQLAAQAMGTTT